MLSFFSQPSGFLKFSFSCRLQNGPLLLPPSSLLSSSACQREASHAQRLPATRAASRRVQNVSSPPQVASAAAVTVCSTPSQYR